MLLVEQTLENVRQTDNSTSTSIPYRVPVPQVQQCYTHLHIFTHFQSETQI